MTTLTKIQDIPVLPGFYYMACPYGHKNKDVTEVRMVVYEKTDARCVVAGLKTFSPLDKHYKLKHAKIPGDYGFWKDYCIAMMQLAVGLIVITACGWEDAPGVQDEIRMAQERGIPVYYV